MNRKSFQPSDLKLSESGTFEAAFAQFNIVDHDGDVTLPGAFPAKEVPMSAFNHSSWDGAPPVGKGMISERGEWAVFTGEFFMNTTHGRDAYETLKGLGPLAEFSYGFSILDSSPDTRDGKRVRVLKALDPFEVSHVLRGAGPTTHLMSIKSGGPGPEMPYAEHADWIRSEVEQFLKRTNDRAEWRAKEGRVLSAANLATLKELADAMGTTARRLAEFLMEHEPPKADRPRVPTGLAIELARARSMGIT